MSPGEARLGRSDLPRRGASTGIRPGDGGRDVRVDHKAVLRVRRSMSTDPSFSERDTAALVRISASLRAATPERDRITALVERYVRGDIEVDELERLVHEALR